MVVDQVKTLALISVLIYQVPAEIKAIVNILLSPLHPLP